MEKIEMTDGPECDIDDNGVDLSTMNERQLKHYYIVKEIVEKRGGKLLSRYENCRIKVKILCGKGHQRWILSQTIKSGHQCAQCGIERSRKRFVSHLESNKYVLLSEFTSVNRNVLIQCNKGHKRMMRPSHILSGHKCLECSRSSTTVAIDKLVKSIANHNGKLVSNYVDNRTKVSVICSEGHKFDALPNSIKKGHWCPICAGVSKKISKKIFYDTVLSMNGAVIGKYMSSKHKIQIECTKKHLFETTPKIIRRGSWCPICKESKGERACRLYFEKHNIEYKTQHIILKTKKKSKPRYDFYLPKHNILVEYDGVQHFQRVPHFHRTPKAFEKRKKADIDKTLEALRQGFTIVRIDHKCIDKIDNHLDIALAVGNKVYLSSQIYEMLLPEHITMKSNLNIAIPKRRCKLIIC